MSQGVLDADVWSQQIDAYVAEVNAQAGRTGPAPVFADGPFAFPMIRSHINADLITVFARAVGDTNPMWNDAKYAAASAWGTMIAPPVLEACLAESSSMPPPPPVPGWGAMQGGSQRRYHEPFRPGDVIRGEDVWHGLEEKTRPGKPYRLFIQRAERRYINQHDRVVASLFARLAITAAPPSATGVPSGPDLSGRQRRRYTADELAAIREDYDRECSGAARRGAEPRFWEDVKAGEVVPDSLKGPYDICDAVAFAGVMGVCPAFAVKLAELGPNIDHAPRDPETGAPHHMIDWHFDDRFAQYRGFPYAPAFGTQLETMMLHPVTNWMSDEGFVTDMDMQIRSVLLTGEASRTTGSVVGKRRDGDRHLVELGMVSETLDGTPYATGKIVVDLPSRDGYSPANRPSQ